MGQLRGRLAVGVGCVGALAAASEDYMARVDPSVHTWTRTVRVAEDTFLLLELRQGNLRAFLNGEMPVDLPEEQQGQLLDVFPADATAAEAHASQIRKEDWAEKMLRYSVGQRPDPNCAVNTENHLEKEIIVVSHRLRSRPMGVVLTFGGLYGGVNGEGPDVPDDPAIELMLDMQQRGVDHIQGLCIFCDDAKVASLTRASALQSAMRTLNIPEDQLLSPSPEVNLPAAFAGELDLLRLDALPHGVSCRVLRNLLRRGVHPRLVALLVLSQVPPPFKYFPLSADGYETPPALMTCSLSAAIEVLLKYDLFLIRLTGPYALFVRRDEWPEALPISEFDCYRRASVWGLQDIPLHFVREWLQKDVDEVLPLLWRNLSHLHSGGPFTLAV